MSRCGVERSRVGTYEERDGVLDHGTVLDASLNPRRGSVQDRLGVLGRGIGRRLGLDLVVIPAVVCLWRGPIGHVNGVGEGLETDVRVDVCLRRANVR